MRIPLLTADSMVTVELLNDIRDEIESLRSVLLAEHGHDQSVFSTEAGRLGAHSANPFVGAGVGLIGAYTIRVRSASPIIYDIASGRNEYVRSVTTQQDSSGLATSISLHFSGVSVFGAQAYAVNAGASSNPTFFSTRIDSSSVVDGGRAATAKIYDGSAPAAASIFCDVVFLVWGSP